MEGYSIKAAANMIGVAPSTLRYYDKEGLLPSIERSESGYRVFSEDDLGMLKVIECLKKTGMPIKDIKQFTEWVKQGDDSLQERYDMFIKRKEAVQAQIDELQKTLEFVEYKIWYYQTALEAGTEAIHHEEKNEAIQPRFSDQYTNNPYLYRHKIHSYSLP